MARPSDESPAAPEARDRLVEQIAARLALPEDECRSVLREVGSAIADTLLETGRCELPGLGLLERRERPGAEVLRAGEHVRVRAPTVELAISPSAAFVQRASSDLRRAVLCLLEEDDPIAGVIARHVHALDWSPRRTTDLATATALLERGVVALAICDMRLEAGPALLERIKIEAGARAPAVLSLHAGGHDPLRTDTFSLLADERRVEPFEVRGLLEAIDRLLARRLESDPIRAVGWVFTTTEAHLERAVGIAQRLLAQTPLEADARVAFAAAFREALANAAEHGNRDDPARRIRVRYLADRRRVQFTIRDEGTGFDHVQLLAERKDADPVAASTAHRRRSPRGRQGGLGLLLMQRCCDRVVFNEAGNEVTLVKRT